MKNNKIIMAVLFFISIVFLYNAKSYATVGFYYKLCEPDINSVYPYYVLTYGESGNEKVELAVSEDKKNTVKSFEVKAIYNGRIVMRIGKEAFSGCTGLEKVTIQKGQILEDEYGCKNVYGVSEIEEKAFYGCTSLKSIFIPYTVREIDDYAFYNCSSLENIDVEDRSYYTDNLYKNGEINEYDPNYPSIKNYTFANCTSLKSLNLKKFGEIGNYTFEGCSCLETITGLNNCGREAFSECKSLKNIAFSDEGYSLGVGVFKNDTSIENIKIPMWAITGTMFSGCSNLKTVSFTQSREGAIPAEMFEDCSSLESITLLEGITWINWEAFNGCVSLKQINIPESVQGIGESAFKNCKKLETITIPSNVTIGTESFKDCELLREVTIHNGDKKISINYSAFDNCKNLEKITIPQNTETIEEWAFHNCTKLKYIGLPIGLKDIKSGAFENCTSLQGVVIPDGITVVESSLFYNCTSLKDVILPESLVTIKGHAFANCSSLDMITIPKNVENIEKFAFDNCENLSKIYFDGNVSNIKYDGDEEFIDWCTYKLGKIQYEDWNNIFGKRKNLTLYVKNKTNILKYAKDAYIKYIITDLELTEGSGDIDGDGEITSFDAYTALELSLSGDDLTDAQIKKLDIDQDGEITSFDAYLILSYSVGIIDNNYWK